MMAYIYVASFESIRQQEVCRARRIAERAPALFVYITL